MSNFNDQDLTPSVDGDDVSSNDLTVSSHLEYTDGTVPLITKVGSGHLSPVRARTMKEYDQQIAELQKENFSLKLRIYFLEEGMKNKWKGGVEDVIKLNIELNVEVESLKKDLIEKQELLKKASAALSSVTNHHQVELQQAKEAGITEGEQAFNNRMEKLKLRIEGLHKDLDCKNMELETFIVESKDTNLKLNELLSMNQILDSKCRQLEREKSKLEMQMEMMNDTNQRVSEDDYKDTPVVHHRDVADEVVRKDRLIEQLRSALRAKDIIIQQVEEEKKETVTEITSEFEKRIKQLQENLQNATEENLGLNQALLTPLKDSATMKVTGLGARQSERECRDISFSRTSSDMEVQTLDSMNDHLTEELERLRKRITSRDEEVMNLMNKLQQAETSAKKQDDELKELRGTLQNERQRNNDSVREHDLQNKMLMEDAQQHSANQDQIILHLVQGLKQKEEQLEQILKLSNLSDASRGSPGVTDIVKDMQKKNVAALEDLVAENNHSLKYKNEEISRLRKSLGEQQADIERIQQELTTYQQTFANMESDSLSTDEALRQVAIFLKDQQIEVKDTEVHRVHDNSNREGLIQQMMTALGIKNQGLCAGSIVSDNLVADLQKQLKTKEDQLKDSENQLFNQISENTKLKESLLKHQQSKESNPKQERMDQQQSQATFQSVGSEDVAGELPTLDGHEFNNLVTEIKSLKVLLAQSLAVEVKGHERETDISQGVSSSEAIRRLDRIELLLGSIDQDAMERDTRGHAISGSSAKFHGRTRQQPRNKMMHLDPTCYSLPLSESSSSSSPNGAIISTKESSRVTSPRTNISYLSVESSKRSSLKKEFNEFSEDHTGQDSPFLLIRSFHSLLPDETALSGMSQDELKDVISNLRQISLDQCRTMQGDNSLAGNYFDEFYSPAQRYNGHSEMAVGSLKCNHPSMDQLEKKLEEREKEISELNVKLFEAQTALRKTIDAVMAFEKEVSVLRKSQNSMKQLEDELSHLRREYDSVERANRLLKEQIELNCNTDSTIPRFNPDLIVRMAKEIDRMKKEVEESRYKKQTTDAAVLVQQTDFDDLVTTGNVMGLNGFQMKMKEEARSSMITGRNQMNRNQKHLNGNLTCTKSDQVEDGEQSTDERKSEKIKVDEKRLSSLPKSQKPVMRNMRPQSLEYDKIEDEYLSAKCKELESRLLAMSAMVESQSDEISYYKGLLEELDPSLMLNSRCSGAFKKPSSPVGHILDADTINSGNNSDLIQTPCQRSSRFRRMDTAERSDLKGDQTPEVKEGLLFNDEIECKVPSGHHELSSGLGSDILSTPLNSTEAANRQAFLQLQSEFRRLKQQLDFSVRENSRLNDTLQMYSEGSFLAGMSPQVLSQNGGTSAASKEDLHHLVESQKEENNRLQQYLFESQNKCDMLRTRLEELSEFLKELMPLMETGSPQKLATLRGKLNETQDLLTDMSQTLNTTHDYSLARLSQPAAYLSQLDLDASSIFKADEVNCLEQTSRARISSIGGRNIAKSSATSDVNVKMEQLQLRISSLSHVNEQLEQRLSEKEQQLAEVNSEAGQANARATEICKEMEVLKNSLHEKLEKMSAIDTEMVVLKNNLSASRKEVEDLNLNNSNLKKVINDLHMTLVDHGAKMSELESKLGACNADRMSDRNRLEHEHANRMAMLEQERNCLLAKIELLTKEICELKVEVIRERERSSASETSRANFSERLNEKDNIIQKLKELVKENKLTADDLKSQLKRLNDDIQEKKLTIQKLSRKCQELQNTVRLSDVSSRGGTCSQKETASLSVDDQLQNKPRDKSSRVGKAKETLTSPERTTLNKGERPSSGEFLVKQSSQIISKTYYVDGREPSKDKNLDFQEQECLDHRPVRDVADLTSGCHLTSTASETTVNSMEGSQSEIEAVVEVIAINNRNLIASGNKLDYSGSKNLATSCNATDAICLLEERVVAAEEMNILLQKELRIYERLKEKVFSVANGDDQATLKEYLEEIRQLRGRLQDSLKMNDSLRSVLKEQVKQTNCDNRHSAEPTSILLVDRETSQLTQDLMAARKEISAQKARLRRVQTELNQKITEIEALKTDKNSVLCSSNSNKLKFENIEAEVKRLKEELKESNELNRIMRLELRLQEMVSKTENKENEQGVIFGASGKSFTGSSGNLQLTDVMVELRHLRSTMEKTVENNNVLRQKLEELSHVRLSVENGKVENSSATSHGSVAVTQTDLDSSIDEYAVGTGHRSYGFVVPAAKQKMAEARKKDCTSGFGHPSQDPQSFVISGLEVYEKLKQEILRNQFVLDKLEESIRTVHSKVMEDDQKKDLNRLIQELRTHLTEQEQSIAMFWILNLSKPELNTTDKERMIENEILRKQLMELRLRYTRAKHAMKGAQERLEANNRRKEEFFMTQKNKKEQAIIEQINKTHQVLVQARQNLEVVHQSGDRTN